MLPQYANDPFLCCPLQAGGTNAAALSSRLLSWTAVLLHCHGVAANLRVALANMELDSRKVAQVAQIAQALSGTPSRHHSPWHQTTETGPADGNIKVMDFGIARARTAVQHR